MKNENTSRRPVNVALEYLYKARDSGVRGRNKEAIEYAIEVLEDNGRGDLKDIHYCNLKVGENLSDPKRPGFRMISNKSGKAWAYRYKSPVDGKDKILSFGTYPEMELGEARTEWKRLKTQRDQGEDPRLKSEADTKATTSVETLCRKYIAEYAKVKKRSWKEDDRQLFFDVTPRFGERPAVDLTRDDIEAMLTEVQERGSPRSAEKLLAVVRKMYNHAIKKRWIPGLTENPCKYVDLDKRDIKSVHLSEAQIKSFMQKLPGLDERDEIKQIWLLQFQAVARISEICDLPWSEVDLEHGIWNLPAERSKNGQSHRIMLSKQSQDLLQKRKEDQPNSPYVFASLRDKKRPVRSDYVMEALARSRKKLGIPDKTTSHSLRHTALTQLATMGCGKEMRDRIANHKDSSVDSIYQHYEHDSEAKEWLQKWADRLDVLSVDNVAIIGQKENEHGSK